jgi:hypothetical protein
MIPHGGSGLRKRVELAQTAIGMFFSDGDAQGAEFDLSVCAAYTDPGWPIFRGESRWLKSLGSVPLNRWVTCGGGYVV